MVLLLTVLLLSACETTSSGPLAGGQLRKQDVAGALGAFGGAWIGSNVGKGKGNIAAIAAGTLLGAYLGSEVGKSLDRADQAYLRNTNQQALEYNPVGTASSWNNPDSGNYGSITPTRTYETAGQYCREYNQTINVGGQQQSGYGTACRQPDGSWQIQS